MTARQFAVCQARIAAGRYPRCNLPVRPWPLQRADVCHVKGAVCCPRHWADIHAAEARLKIRNRV